VKTVDELVRIDEAMRSMPLPRATSKWGGADAAITTLPAVVPSQNRFYPEPFRVVTDHAMELSWLFEALRDAFYAEKRLDSCSKIAFFGRLATTANRYLSAQPGCDAQALCSAVLGEAFAVYGEMEAGRFGGPGDVAGTEIADDSVRSARYSASPKGDLDIRSEGSLHVAIGSHLEIRIPEAIRRIADSEDRKLAWEFFVFFSRFEYALKCTHPYLKGGPSNAQPDWDRFASDHDAAFQRREARSVREAIEYFRSHPPRKQVVEEGGLGWSDPLAYASGPELVWLLRAIRTVRNNLFHGGKFPVQYMDDSSRDSVLLQHSLTILNACVSLDPQVASCVQELLPD